MADQPPAERDREALTAYLDGELEGPARSELEARLNTDPRLRAEFDTMRRTWEMLDYLPRPRPSPAFTSQTLDRISAYRPAARRRLRPVPWALGVGWAAAVLVAGVAGFAGTRALRPTRPAPMSGPEAERQMQHDLRVIQNRRPYEVVGDIDFLRALADPDDPDLFGAEHSNL